MSIVIFDYIKNIFIIIFLVRLDKLFRLRYHIKFIFGKRKKHIRISPNMLCGLKSEPILNNNTFCSNLYYYILKRLIGFYYNSYGVV